MYTKKAVSKESASAFNTDEHKDIERALWSAPLCAARIVRDNTPTATGRFVSLIVIF